MSGQGREECISMTDITNINDNQPLAADASEAAVSAAAIESTEAEAIESSADAAAEEERVCCNCGTVNSSDSAYCRHCGQSMAVGRLRTRSFLMDVVSSLLRVNKGILFTSGHLLWHPWKVIRDYIRGKRVAYTPPVNLMILLIFIMTLLDRFSSTLYGTVSNTPDLSGTSKWYRVGVSIGDFFRGPSAVAEIIVYIPALFAVWLVYRRWGAKRYNLAEYLAAVIYMSDALLLFGIITYPLSFVEETAYNLINFLYTMAMGLIGLYTAFPTGSKMSRVRHNVYFVLLSLLIYFIVVIMMYLIFG